MRIALISEHASPLAATGSVDAGGQNIYVAHVARQLARAGHQVDVFTRRDNPLLPEISRMGGGARVIHVPAGPPTAVPKEKLLPFIETFGDWMIEFARRQRQPYDVVHANFFMSGLAALRIKAALGTPVVTTFHALGKVRRLHQGEADGFPDERFAIEDRLVAESDRIVAECPQDYEDLINLYGASAASIDTVPCGFDSSEFAPQPRQLARRRLGWRDDEFAILQLGRLVPRKGVDNVIRSLAALSDAHRERARLYVVGGNSEIPNEIATPEIARLRGLAESLGVASRITFVGRRGRNDLRHFYSASDVFVTTPWYEPFGITPVEAMACGTAVIGSRVGGIQHTVVDGDTGLLVPPNDPTALAQALGRLMDNPALQASFGEAGLKRATRRYTWANVAAELAAVYARAAGLEPDEIEQLQPREFATLRTASSNARPLAL
ncbi:glycosyltransferase family 4 protein [Chitinasiproducens palmae]|uniref:glycosyltransferase family 4 protein n=1 Tax=Chitinasiproducens palmae TaxID=1770053 RepID=UPI000B83CE99|nr:glycosyltransferase family 1 protein [Chitinasiproducens palmae]